MRREFQCGAWRIASDPQDGGRLCSVNWRGHELLTPRPEIFRPPAKDFGRFETRPVHGYDDCFPTVDACRLTEPALEAPDHGELCWLPARVEDGPGWLRSRWGCRTWPAVFERELRVQGDTLAWHFSVVNTSEQPLPYLHVMHALMPPEGIVALRLPPCREIVDEIADAPLGGPSAGAPEEALLATPRGTARMWLLQDVADGWAQVTWRTGVRLTVRFPVDRFPTLGIWWNRYGYPGEPDTRRDEFALEPIPGPYSSLARSAAAGRVPVLAPRGTQCWTISWDIEAVDPIGRL